jgi:hypothetical protein
MYGFGRLVGFCDWRTARRLGLPLAGAVGALIAAGQTAQALLLNVTYPNPANVPAAAVTEINSVTTFLQNSFVNNATVNVTVDFTASCGLGCSSTLGFINVPYTLWRSSMIADSAANPQNRFLASAIRTLPAADPIGNGFMRVVRTANAEALGIASFSGTDSSLTFTNDGVTFEYTGVPTPGLWDFQNVFEHELDEALGISSALTRVVNNDPLPVSFDPEDYFRYSATPNVRSVTTNPAAAVFFS